MNLADTALENVRDGFVVGLGSGRASTSFVQALGRRVREGLRVRGIPTSNATAALARQLGIPLATFDDVETIDLAVDGADEVDPRLNLIKGRGGALVREKIVAVAARRLLILVGPEKLVPTLGSHGVLPVEVVPFGNGWCRRRLTELGYPATPRAVNGQLVVTDNGNPILDCAVPVLSDPAALQLTVQAIPGVVGTGLFLGMADTVLIERGDQVEIRRRPTS
jgi:ribose 5-phosphate isomerase A